MGRIFKIKSADLHYVFVFDVFLTWSVAGVYQIVSCVMGGPVSVFVVDGGRDDDKKARP